MALRLDPASVSSTSAELGVYVQVTFYVKDDWEGLVGLPRPGLVPVIIIGVNCCQPLKVGLQGASSPDLLLQLPSLWAWGLRTGP